MNNIKNVFIRNNRKIYWFMILTIMTGTIISGCTKFLDRKPLTATLDDLHQGSMEGLSLNLYTTLRTYSGFSSLPWIDFHSIRGDDAEKGSNQTDGAEINAEFDTYNYTKDDWATNTYWNDHYAMISQANKVLYTADSLKVKDEASLRNIGEACFFRAYSYFELVKAYGEVPKINFYIKTASQGIVPKTTVTDLYTLIDSDLTVAQKYLPINTSSYGAAYPGRLTKGAANTLWAQTYLFRQNWAMVIALTKQVMASGQYSLLPKFPDLWKEPTDGSGKNTAESIFEMNCTVGANAASNSKVDFGSAWGTSQQVRQGGAPVSWNLGWGWNTPTQSLVDAWDNSDPRKNYTILYSGRYDGGSDSGGFGATLPPYNADEIGGIARKYWSKKLYTGNDPGMRQMTGYVNNNGQAPWIDHRILRYADVVLMLAEASNETGDGATAEAMLELVRARSRGNNAAALPHIAYTDQASMRTAIKNERRWEFAMEGYRFYDLVRWGDAQSVLGGLGYTNRARYYPIPQPAIDLSGGVLKQNPEW